VAPTISWTKYVTFGLSAGPLLATRERNGDNTGTDHLGFSVVVYFGGTIPVTRGLGIDLLVLHEQRLVFGGVPAAEQSINGVAIGVRYR
jgi:hypothetical protein